MNDIPSPDQLGAWKPLDELGGERLERLHAKASAERLKRGVRLEAARETRHLVYLLKGRASVSEPDGEGAFIEAGSATSAHPLFDGLSRRAVARLDSGSVVMRLPRSLFDLLLDEQRQSAYQVQETYVGDSSMRLVQRLLTEIHGNRLELPVMPKIARHLAAMDEDDDLDKLYRILRLEPSLAGRIIQACNSPAYRRPGHTVTLLSDAIALLGFVTVRQLALAMTLSAPFKVKAPEARKLLAPVWRDSVRVSVVAALIARESATSLNSERCLLAGLMHQVGHIPIILYSAEEGGAGSGELQEALDQVGGMIGREVLSFWGFEEAVAVVPERLQEVTQPQEGQPSIADAVSLARILCDRTRGGKQPEGLPADRYPGTVRLGLDLADPGACATLLERSRSELRELQQALG
ncbi:HDOD domain-containing protein [Aquisalimonas sp. 2447]|uniref:HDOD domain-containing protein n=1 Tax=Aquisalimonas sp. 2447 TaxID=2740807 RepID=UPI0014323183|nr:HDOD domain-containing protein [Aquisalimonas sp. 2447]QIT56590.1 HDOD domain-containing protein [Aquisalimonas sp. 2447]